MCISEWLCSLYGNFYQHIFVIKYFLIKHGGLPRIKYWNELAQVKVVNINK